MNTELQRFFKQYLKDDLITILDFFEQPYEKSTKKAELVDMVCEYIGGHPVDWLFMLPERDLRLLKELVEHGPNIWIPMTAQECPCVIEGLHLIFADDTDLSRVSVLLPYEIYSLISPFVSDVIKDKEAANMFEKERIGLGILNIYGVLPLDEFIEILFEMFPGDHSSSVEVAHCPYVVMQRVFYVDDCYLVSPFVYDYKAILEARKPFNKKIRKYRKCTKEEAISAGSPIPFCSYGHDMPMGEDVISVLMSLGLTREMALEEIHEMWIDAQFTTDQSFTEALFNYVNDKIDDIQSFAEYKRCIDTIAAYANSIPKWLLKGRTSTDAGLLQLSIKVDEETYTEFVEEDKFFSPYSPENGIEEPADGPLDQFYKLGIGIRHVHPDAPCPCGSGISYRFCHGRKLN